MTSVIKKIAMLSMLVSITGNRLLFTVPYLHLSVKQNEPLNLMPSPTNEKAQTVNIKVSNIPANHFIAAGVAKHNSGETNYSMQPNNNGIYTFSSDHYYAAAANDRGSFEKLRKGSEFIGKTKWDVNNNIIS